MQARIFFYLAQCPSPGPEEYRVLVLRGKNDIHQEKSFFLMGGEKNGEMLDIFTVLWGRRGKNIIF